MRSAGVIAQIGVTVLHSLWIGALIAAWAAAALHMLRTGPSAVRYRLALGALAAATVTPFLVARASTPAEAGWLQCIGLVWVAGVTTLSVKLVNSLRLVTGLRRQSTPAPANWSAALAGIAAAAGLRRAVALRESTAIEVPCSLGVTRPVVLMPAGLLERMTPDAFTAIAAHELAHVARRDYFWNLVQVGLETALFFHPAAFWLTRVIHRERERCCDAAAGAICRPAELARALASLEQARGHAGHRAADRADRPLLDRVHALMSADTGTGRAMSATAWVLVAVSAAAVPLLWVAARAEGPPPAQWLAWTTAAGLGLIVGLRHALEPDHLVAVATLLTRERDAGSAARLGAAWGAGHTVALLTLGSVVVVARRSLPAGMAGAFEGAVAVMVIVMGVRAIREGLRLSTHGPRLAHRHGRMRHTHATAGPHVHIGPLAIARRPLLIGVVHGLAGSGALTALAVASLPSWPEQVGYLLVFGLGSTAGMAAAAGLAGWHLTRFVRTPAAIGALSMATGGLAVVAGIAWAIPLIVR